MFPADAVIRRVDSELVLLLGGGRALLMQLAHPMVARGVAEHSDFETDPLARLERTLTATYAVVFGTAEQAARAGGAVHAVHERVTGAGYHANDPELLMWVHATLVDTALAIHRRFLRPLSDDGRRALLPGVHPGRRGLRPQPGPASPRTSPPSGATSRTMVGRPGRRPDRPVPPTGPIRPPSPAARWSPHRSWPGVRELTAGLVPARLRRAYGLPWDRGRQAALDAAGLALRTGLPLVPPVLRRLPSGAVRLLGPAAA